MWQTKVLNFLSFSTLTLWKKVLPPMFLINLKIEPADDSKFLNDYPPGAPYAFHHCIHINFT